MFLPMIDPKMKNYLKKKVKICKFNAYVQIHIFQIYQ